jgi:23S rRNA-/tRNA-specific pseudouridylate synthase
MELFEKREVEKQYLALVDGIPSEMEGIRKSLLGKKGSFEGQTIWGSGSQGVTAITAWKVVAKGDRASLIQCEPETGRTHQIRVHMAEMGHPILVDRQYSQTYRCPQFFPRTFLHAHRLRFTLEGKLIEITAQLPPDMRHALRSVEISFS